MSGLGLAERLVGLHAGQADGLRVVAEFRWSVVLVPTQGGEPLAGGIQWLYAYALSNTANGIGDAIAELKKLRWPR